jgi:pyruvate-ferredoxin/flavodoxin oxidoreductase
MTAAHPVRFAVDYPDREPNRLTTAFPIFTAIDGTGLLLTPLLMIVFRQKYPRWWFDWNLALLRFGNRLAVLSERLAQVPGPAADDLRSVLDHLVRRSVWIVGGDGWAYDIGSGGLDHVLASGHNVNVLVLDTEVYSNTGGQTSEATPLGAVAKFAAAGKTIPTKDLALQAIGLANVFVARIAMGADPQQTLQALREAEAYDGPSLVIAYSHCIAHGYDMRDGLDQQYRAVASGHWPLIRYDPAVRAAGNNPFLLDSPRPRIPLGDYRNGELRFRALANAEPAEAERLLGLAQDAADLRWRTYEEMATCPATQFPADARQDA